MLFRSRLNRSNSRARDLNLLQIFKYRWDFSWAWFGNGLVHSSAGMLLPSWSRCLKFGPGSPSICESAYFSIPSYLEKYVQGYKTGKQAYKNLDDNSIFLPFSCLILFRRPETRVLPCTLLCYFVGFFLSKPH